MGAEGHRPGWLVEPLGGHHDRAPFDCGNEPLGSYLRHRAAQDMRRRVAAPFVAVPATGSGQILGYYTLSAFAVELGTLPDEVARRLPRYPLVPATLLGRLAVDHRERGKGLGEFLLMDELHRALHQSSRIAAAAVIVDAIDAEGARFYRHFEFEPFPERTDRLFLPMTTVARLFGNG